VPITLLEAILKAGAINGWTAEGLIAALSFSARGALLSCITPFFANRLPDIKRTANIAIKKIAVTFDLISALLTVVNIKKLVG